MVIGLLVAQASYGADAPSATSKPADGESYLDVASRVCETKPAPAKEKGLPLPFHTIEGYGGGSITPMAYLVNPGPKDTIFGLPSAGFTNLIAGNKNIQALTITETILRRIELGYAINRFGTGTFEDDVQDATGIDIHNTAIYMHNWNIRGNLVEENAYDLKWLPAITAGVHLKYNQDIEKIDERLGGALSNIGYDDNFGQDYTLTASKTIVDKTWTLDRPLILTAGMRNSNASQLGFLGFGGDRTWTPEGSIAYLPVDWLVVAYEYRGKNNPYDRIPGLVGDEDNWHAIDVSWLINKHATLLAGWGALGNVANSTENCAWWLQFKYEF